jgi:hypothetical protein
MSFEISTTSKQTFVNEHDYNTKLPNTKFEDQPLTPTNKQTANSKPSIEKPAPATWPGVNSMLTGIGEIMLLLAKVGIALRDQQREQTKLHHDSAVQALEKSAEHVRDQAKTAFITAAVSFGFSVGLSAMSIRSQVKSNTSMSSAQKIDNKVLALKSEQGQLQSTQTSLAQSQKNISNLESQSIKLKNSGGMSNTYATTYSQSIMASSQIIGGVGQGVQSLSQAKEKESDAISQTHQKASDLASQDYQEMEKFRSNLVGSLKEIVNLMNEIVKTTTQV